MADDEDRAFHLLVWGYAIEGDVLQVDALIAEGSHDLIAAGVWDRTAVDLVSISRHHGDREMPVPDWWALPHLPMDWRLDALAAETA